MRITKDPEVRRSELIEAAQALFQERGYQQTSVSDIVKKVGVAQGTFYYYFASKDDILNAVIDHYIDGFKKVLEHLLSQEGMDPCRKIEVVADAMIGIHRYHPYLVKFLRMEENDFTNLLYMRKSFDAIAPLISGIIEQGRAAGTFKIDYPQETVELLIYAFGYLEDSVANPRDEATYIRVIRASEDILARVLGVEPGRVRLDPSRAGNVPQLLRSLAAQPGA